MNFNRWYLRWLVGWLIIATPFTDFAQSTKPPVVTNCGTVELSPVLRKVLEQKMDSALTTRSKLNPGITYVPIRPHIVRRSDGSGGFTLPALHRVMATVNRYYLLNGSGIQFYFAGATPDYVDDDAVYAGVASESVVDGRDASNALNQYYVNAFSQAGLGGYAYYPDNTIQSTRSFILTGGSETEDDLGNRLIPHELGHTFNLVHTFGNSNTGTTTELVARGSGANCTTDGDFICDTPADPYRLPNASTTTDSNGCLVYNGTAVDPGGMGYAPSVTNIMSYYFPCTHDFTPGQYARVQGGLALRQSYVAYSINYPPDPVPAPGNLTATLSLRGSVNLTWQDNATNESGYFIERATALNGPFIAVSGVGPNMTTFSDGTVAANTLYYYRIRPSNTTLGSLSVTANVLTQRLTCIPAYSAGGCTYDDGIVRVVVNGDTLSHDPGCSGTVGYSEFRVLTEALRVGKAIPFSVSFMSSLFEEGLTIWADTNRNGTYEPGEIVFKAATAATGGMAGSLTIPASVSAGPLTLRFVVAYGTVPNLPCGTYGYGETEDYQLAILPATGATIYSVKDGAWNDPAVWVCQCIPTAVDLVQVKHVVSVPNGFVAHALSLREEKQLRYETRARLRLGL